MHCYTMGFRLNVLVPGLLLANLFQREQEDVTFPLMVSSGVKMIDEVG